MSDLSVYLKSTPYFDFDEASVRAFADAVVDSSAIDPVEIATALYLAVRDDIRYNPYSFDKDAKSMSASWVLEHKSTYCVPKAVLLGAVARYKRIPSRLGLADVRNHVASPQFVEMLGTNVFAMHGYIELFLEGKWVKATPAFNAELCEIMGVAPLEFNGREDSIFHEFTDDGRKHMEYLKDYGTFDDVPYDFFVQSIKEAYPHMDAFIEEYGVGKSLEQDMAALKS